MSFAQIIVLILILIITPAGLGMGIYALGKNYSIKPGLLYLYGLMCEFTLFQAVVIPWIIRANRDVSVLADCMGQIQNHYLYSLIVCFVLGVGLFVVRQIVSKKKFFFEKIAMTKIEWILWIVFAVILLVQLFFSMIKRFEDGDDAYFNQKFVHTADPFANKGDGTGAYALYKILFDAVEQGLIEDDYTTTDWEGCKGMINRGEIASMVLGSWAFVQMQQGDSHPEDIGYMPFPMTVGGTQYVLAGGDYNYGINVNASDDNKIASMIFIKWMTEESGWCYDEGGYTVDIDGVNPDMYAAFDGATLLSDQPALAGEEAFVNDMNAESELSFNAGGNDKVQRIVEAAATGSETFDDIMADWTAKWNDAQEELGIEVLY